MALYQAGSAEAFDRLHDALASDLKGYLTTLTRDPTRADDLLQDTFLLIHRARASHTPGEPVRPWIFAIARRVFLMHVRSASRRDRYEQLSAPATGSTAEPATQLDDRRRLQDALRRAPADGRRAFLMHHWLGFSFKEIAAKLGITHGTAKIRSSRAASAMRAWLREDRHD